MLVTAYIRTQHQGKVFEAQDMKRFVMTSLSALKRAEYQHGIQKALALNLRGEVRHDGLTLAKVVNQLAIEWYARDIHPWDRDRDLSVDERERLFLEQSLADTEAAINRLFEMLPQVDVISLRVLDARSQSPLLAGSVLRCEVERNARLSVGMRLRLSGITFRLSGWGLQPLAAEKADLGDAVAF
jgi:hypothetical protein